MLDQALAMDENAKAVKDIVPSQIIKNANMPNTLNRQSSRPPARRLKKSLELIEKGIGLNDKYK